MAAAVVRRKLAKVKCLIYRHLNQTRRFPKGLLNEKTKNKLACQKPHYAYDEVRHFDAIVCRLFMVNAMNIIWKSGVGQKAH
jgi:hypothetical protein